VSVLSNETIQRLRAETPGCARVTHFNHAGASLMPQQVIDVTVGHLHREAEIGGYEAADEAHDRLEATYTSIARLINARPHEIAVVENATRGWDMAFYAIPLTAGDRILTSASEYGSNVISFLQVAERGVSVEVIPTDPAGQVSVAALKEMLDDRVKVVAISHMPTNGGLVQPAAEIGEVVRGSGAIYILDACQTVGQMPIDVNAIGCDVLTATSRKYLRGPRGVGFLYVRGELIESLQPPFLDNHAATWVSTDRIEIRKDARRFENWESYVAGKLGMGAAIDHALDLGLDSIWETIDQQATLLRSRLSTIPGVSVQDLGHIRGGIVTFNHDRVPADAIKKALAAQSINATTSSIFSTRFDMEARGLSKLVRTSVHYLTTDEEIDRLVETLSNVLSENTLK
jgi:cysteine desulfurase/selenocysteine lyase